jgi:CHAD domain-containing protein
LKGKELEIKERESFKEGILRLMDRLHDEASRYILAQSRQHISIHELRKNIKKMRGIIRLIRHEIGHDRYHELNDKYRHIAQQVAVLRDDTSQIELLESMQKNVDDDSIHQTILKAIRQVERKRKDAFTQFYDSNRHYTVCYEILSMKEEIQKLEFDGNPDSFILKSLKRIHGRARSAMEVSGFLKIDEIYHYWRKQVKYLMYQLMILNLAWPSYFKVYIGELNKLSNLLGKLHDLNLFNEHLHEEKLIKLNSQQKRLMLKYIYQRRAVLKKRIEKTGEKLFSESSEAFSLRIYDIWIHEMAENEDVNREERLRMDRDGHEKLPFKPQKRELRMQA